MLVCFSSTLFVFSGRLLRLSFNLGHSSFPVMVQSSFTAVSSLSRIRLATPGSDIFSGKSSRRAFIITLATLLCIYQLLPKCLVALEPIDITSPTAILKTESRSPPPVNQSLFVSDHRDLGFSILGLAHFKSSAPSWPISCICGPTIACTKPRSSLFSELDFSFVCLLRHSLWLGRGLRPSTMLTSTKRSLDCYPHDLLRIISTTWTPTLSHQTHIFMVPSKRHRSVLIIKLAFHLLLMRRHTSKRGRGPLSKMLSTLIQCMVDYPAASQANSPLHLSNFIESSLFLLWNGQFVYSRVLSISFSWTAFVPQPRYQSSFCRGQKRSCFPSSFLKERFVPPSSLSMCLVKYYLEESISTRSNGLAVADFMIGIPLVLYDLIAVSSLLNGIVVKVRRLQDFKCVLSGKRASIYRVTYCYYGFRLALLAATWLDSMACTSFLVTKTSSRTLPLSSTLERTVPPSYSAKEFVFQRSKVLKTLRAICVVRSPLMAEALDIDFISIIFETFWQKFPVFIYDDYRHSILYLSCTLISVTSVYSLANSSLLVT